MRAAVPPSYYSSHSLPVSQSFVCFASLVSGVVNGQREHRMPFRHTKGVYGVAAIRLLWTASQPRTVSSFVVPVQNQMREPARFLFTCFKTRNKSPEREKKHIQNPKQEGTVPLRAKLIEIVSVHYGMYLGLLPSISCVFVCFETIANCQHGWLHNTDRQRLYFLFLFVVMTERASL